jgi:hypothetical protein
VRVYPARLQQSFGPAALDDAPVVQHDVVSVSFPAATRWAIISVVLPAIAVL